MSLRNLVAAPAVLLSIAVSMLAYAGTSHGAGAAVVQADCFLPIGGTGPANFGFAFDLDADAVAIGAPLKDNCSWNAATWSSPRAW